MPNFKILVGFLLLLFNIHNYSTVRLGVDFKTHHIVPEIIENAPQRRVYVSYDNNRTVIKTGCSYDRQHLTQEPLILWQCREGSTYTIIMTCLDDTLANLTNREKQVHWWLVTNIQNCSVSSGESIFPYQLVNRLPMGAFQRIVILAFTQMKPIYNHDFPKVTGTDEDSRESFTIKEFVNAHTLGNALAGNYFRLGY
ncbi:protein D2-like isoform X2 [Planococcus citri]|uniref:protein D2-like isoform X2 n=1 Tax=Planococcus citri TaxID=170843 RepID=UPI0031FA1454